MTNITPGLVIAAPRSGSGKTTLTLGLLRALRNANVRVSSAKCGPDYIDGHFHRAASGNPSINLDSWAMPPELIASLAAQVGGDCDLVICEALMGLFDGVPAAPGRSGSSADVAAALGWPVLLVLDASGQSQSAAAVVKGFACYDPRIKIAGVVLNRLGSERHARLARNAIEALGIPVVGTLPRSDAVALPERHLGLVQAGETRDLEQRLEAMAEFVAVHTDIDRIRALAAPGIVGAASAMTTSVPVPGQRIAIARDTAFSFLYPHMLHDWRARGAEIHFFSPLADEAPDPICDSCWLPGGYPELHGEKIANARNFMTGLRQFAATNPVHGECGGYMVLGKSLTDAHGTSFEMANLLDVSTNFAKRKLHLGYRRATLIADGGLGRAGSRFNGHEFHYASIETLGDDAPLAMVSDAYGSDPVPAGSRRGNVSGSFFHVIAVAS